MAGELRCRFAEHGPNDPADRLRDAAAIEDEPAASRKAEIVLARVLTEPIESLIASRPQAGGRHFTRGLRRHEGVRT